MRWRPTGKPPADGGALSDTGALTKTLPFRALWSSAMSPCGALVAAAPRSGPGALLTAGGGNRAGAGPPRTAFRPQDAAGLCDSVGTARPDLAPCGG